MRIEIWQFFACLEAMWIMGAVTQTAWLTRDWKKTLIFATIQVVLASLGVAGVWAITAHQEYRP